MQKRSGSCFQELAVYLVYVKIVLLHKIVLFHEAWEDGMILCSPGASGRLTDGASETELRPTILYRWEHIAIISVLQSKMRPTIVYRCEHIAIISLLKTKLRPTLLY